MNRDTEITPFEDRSSQSGKSPNLGSPKIRRVYRSLRWAGLAGFWVQLVLGVISTVMLLLAIINKTERSNPGTGFSLFCAVCGLVCLIVSIYFSFRYGKMSQRLQRNIAPPKKSATIRAIKIGLIVNLTGMLLTIIGAEAIAGIVLSKILAFDPARIFNSQTNTEFVNSLDLFIVQANTNIIAAHFAGLTSSLWLLSRITE